MDYAAAFANGQYADRTKPTAEEIQAVVTGANPIELVQFELSNLDFDTTDLTQLEAKIRTSLQESGVAGFATMPMTFARGSIIVTLRPSNKADASAAKKGVNAIIGGVQNLFTTTTAAPTDAPTDAPTAAPTDSPTAAPTDPPTDKPTTTTTTTTGAPTTIVAPTEALTTTVAATEAPTSTVAPTEAHTATVATTEAHATTFATTEAPTTIVIATEAPTNTVVATEAPTTTTTTTTDVPATTTSTTTPITTSTTTTAATTTSTTTTTTTVAPNPPLITTTTAEPLVLGVPLGVPPLGVLPLSLDEVAATDAPSTEAPATNAAPATNIPIIAAPATKPNPSNDGSSLLSDLPITAALATTGDALDGVLTVLSEEAVSINEEFVLGDDVTTGVDANSANANSGLDAIQAAAEEFIVGSTNLTRSHIAATRLNKVQFFTTATPNRHAFLHGLGTTPPQHDGVITLLRIVLARGESGWLRQGTANEPTKWFVVEYYVRSSLESTRAVANEMDAATSQLVVGDKVYAISTPAVMAVTPLGSEAPLARTPFGSAARAVPVPGPVCSADAADMFGPLYTDDRAQLHFTCGAQRFADARGTLLLDAKFRDGECACVVCQPNDGTTLLAAGLGVDHTAEQATRTLATQPVGNGGAAAVTTATPTVTVSIATPQVFGNDETITGDATVVSTKKTVTRKTVEVKAIVEDTCVELGDSGLASYASSLSSSTALGSVASDVVDITVTCSASRARRTRRSDLLAGSELTALLKFVQAVDTSAVIMATSALKDEAIPYTLDDGTVKAIEIEAVGEVEVTEEEPETATCDTCRAQGCFVGDGSKKATDGPGSCSACRSIKSACGGKGNYYKTTSTTITTATTSTTTTLVYNYYCHLLLA